MMNYGLRPLRKKFHVSLRFMREIPRPLLSKERGHEKRHGDFRET